MIVINQSKIDPAVKKNLKVLATMNLDFYVGGSLLCQYYLKDHARYTKDIDLVISNNPREIEEDFKKAFGQIEFTCSNGTEKFYEPYFTCYTKIDGLRGQVEGMKIDSFKDIKTEQYSYDGINFTGVRIEFIIADKIIALLNELPRPYKHLVDIYSFSRIDQSLFDKEEVKRYMALINDQENRFRKRINLKEYELPKQIPENKVLSSPSIVPTLQGKYNITREEMISEVNRWLKTFL